MSPRTILTAGNFFLSVSATLVSYTLLSYLSTFITPGHVGYVVAIGAAVAVIAFPFMPRLVAHYGAQQLALWFGFLEMILLFAVAAAPDTLVSAILVVFVVALQPLLYYELDLLLEATMQSEGSTGRVRTLFLTGSNIGSLVAPLLIGTLLASSTAYVSVFLAAAVATVPFVILFSSRRLPKGAVPHPAHVRNTLKHLSHNPDLAAVTIAHLILYLFYFWAPLYVPLYLHGVLGIPWSTLGWVFSIMLIPYVIIEYPAGWIADRLLGDKEMLLAGFVIMGVALISVGLITKNSSLITILLILVATRSGAALVESMTEGHFFRRVSEKDIISVSVFRGVWPVANVVAPLVGSAILYFGTYQLFFVLTGGVVLVAGILSTLKIQDFR